MNMSDIDLMMTMKREDYSNIMDIKFLDVDKDFSMICHEHSN